MIEVILALCLIWNTMYLMSRREDTSYRGDGYENYTPKLYYWEGEGKDRWGHGMVLLVPKEETK